jgi:predicted RNase H-like HicB family nuclease
MAQRFYPAVLERGAHDTYGVWFPDFPGCIAAARSQEDAMGKAQEALAIAVERLAEREEALPAPSPFEAIEIPPGCDFVTYFAVGVEPPDPSERVNVYLPKGLIARADRWAAEFGMSRSSLFGLALSAILRGDDTRRLEAALIRARAAPARAQARGGARKRA